MLNNSNRQIDQINVLDKEIDKMFKRDLKALKAWKELSFTYKYLQLQEYVV